MCRQHVVGIRKIKKGGLHFNNRNPRLCKECRLGYVLSRERNSWKSTVVWFLFIWNEADEDDSDAIKYWIHFSCIYLSMLFFYHDHSYQWLSSSQYTWISVINLLKSVIPGHVKEDVWAFNVNSSYLLKFTSKASSYLPASHWTQLAQVSIISCPGNWKQPPQESTCSHLAQSSHSPRISQSHLPSHPLV